ncbi:DUF6497 family protein [Thalassococcus sp. S3]|uniref:DUF6497 family protein n=1 Tax=Thalassococcus sp. S3 TaxID=2017482 RepID=UPI00352F424C
MICLLLSTSPVFADVPVQVPSGQDVVLSEVLLDEEPGALWVRFRFIAPQIARDAGGVDAETAGIDMDHLCETVAVPYIAQHDLDPARIVISFSDRDVAFGTPDPAATQFFEIYRLENARCSWEQF